MDWGERLSRIAFIVLFSAIFYYLTLYSIRSELRLKLYEQQLNQTTAVGELKERMK